MITIPALALLIILLAALYASRHHKAVVLLLIVTAFLIGLYVDPGHGSAVVTSVFRKMLSI